MSEVESELAKELGALQVDEKEIEKLTQKVAARKKAIDTLKQKAADDIKKVTVKLDETPVYDDYLCPCKTGEGTECDRPRHWSICYKCDIRYCTAICGSKGKCCECAGI
jgi:hypothetical protein